VAHGIISTALDTWSHYVNLVHTVEENEKLKKDNQVLYGEAMRAKKLQNEAIRLRKLLGFKEGLVGIEKHVARVIAKDVSPYYRVIKVILDVGENVGVAKGMPVVTHEGVVGRLHKVGFKTAEVLLAVDSRSQVNVRISGKGVIGVLQGKGDKNEYGARFRFLHRSMPVEPYDAVVTTGHDKVFPPDLVVGYVAETEMRQHGFYYEFDVVPAVNFSILEEVLILDAGQEGILVGGGEEDQK